MKAILIAVLAALLATGPALAETRVVEVCGPFAVLTEQLADRYGETEFFTGLGGDMGVHVFASDAGTWTVVLMPLEDDTACVAAWGDEWIGKAPPPQGTEG